MSKRGNARGECVDMDGLAGRRETVRGYEDGAWDDDDCDDSCHDNSYYLLDR